MTSHCKKLDLAETRCTLEGRYNLRNSAPTWSNTDNVLVKIITRYRKLIYSKIYYKILQTNRSLYNLYKHLFFFNYKLIVH